MVVAIYSVSKAKHATLTASTVDTVTLTAAPTSPLSGNIEVEVVNWDANASIYFTTDGTTPAAAADNTYVVGPGSALKVALAGTAVKLISASAAAYSVTEV